MEKMLFTSQQPAVAIRTLPDGKRDVTVLTGEEVVVVENLTADTVPCKTMMYQYTGNQFRTVYALEEEDILADMEKYLNYDPDGEPTLEQLRHEDEIINAAIDSYTLELMEGGVL